jgi:hypothetical protein
MVLTFNVRRSKAFAITGGTMIACWAVGAIIAFATGYQLSTNDLAREKVVELCEMEKGFYDQLLNKMGTDLTKGLFTSQAIVESVISGAVSSFSDKVSISLRWINDHLAELKPMANDWLNQIKTKFFASDVSSHVLNFEELGHLIGSDYYTGFYSFDNWNYYDFVNSIYSGVFQDNSDILEAQDALAGMFYLAYFNDHNKPYQGGGVSLAFKGLSYSSNFNESIIKSMLLAHTAYLEFGIKNEYNRYLVVNVKDTSGKSLAEGDLRLHPAFENSSINVKAYYVLPAGVKVLVPGKQELKDIVLKPSSQELDNVKNYTDNLNDSKLDGVGYVSPNSLQLDKTNHDTYVVSNPGELDFPYTLPNDLTVDPTEPYVGTDGKTVDKPWNPTLPWALPSDLPVSIPLPNDTVLPNDLPYDDVIDATKDDPMQPTLDPDYTTPKVNDDEYSDTYRDWHKIFPFCIPWDYAKIVNFFRADKKAPSFEFDLGNVVSSGKKSKTLKVDLSEYEEQGKWLRNLELILFAVGLLMITRYIIKG